jgi:hypothetical protein
VIGLDGVSAQALSDTIGAIYDCALDPQQWPATCGKIAALCESSAGGICVHDMRHVQNDQLFVFGYEPEFLEKLGEHYAQSPMAASDVVADIGEVSALSMERDELVESRFFRDVLEPFGLQDIMWFPALRTGGRMASMHASRRDKAPLYQQREISLFKLLSPHVCRVLAISDALDIRAVRSETLERTLDGLVAGVFLTAPPSARSEPAIPFASSTTGFWPPTPRHARRWRRPLPRRRATTSRRANIPWRSRTSAAARAVWRRSCRSTAVSAATSSRRMRHRSLCSRGILFRRR